MPASGDVLYVGANASVQFAARPIRFRVIRVHDWNTYTGWIWLDGYELDTAGDAVERRSIFVQVGGLRYAGNPSCRGAGKARGNERPAIPRPRTSPNTSTGRRNR
jgi:hypothetical protein